MRAWFSFSLSKSYLCSSRSRQIRPERGRGRGSQGVRERTGRGRESARVCVRAAFGALGICARRNTVRAKGGGDEREIIGPLLSADGCARTHKHTHTAHTRTDDTRGSGGHHAQGHRPRAQTLRRDSRAACDRMQQLPVSQKTNAVSVPSPPPRRASESRN